MCVFVSQYINIYRAVQVNGIKMVIHCDLNESHLYMLIAINYSRTCNTYIHSCWTYVMCVFVCVCISFSYFEYTSKQKHRTTKSDPFHLVNPWCCQRNDLHQGGQEETHTLAKMSDRAGWSTRQWRYSALRCKKNHAVDVRIIQTETIHC